MVALAETPLTGRESHLATLSAAVSRVAGGESGILAMVGLVGTGKTRLAREGLAMAASAGFANFSGHADAIGGVRRAPRRC